MRIRSMDIANQANRGLRRRIVGLLSEGLELYKVSPAERVKNSRNCGEEYRHDAVSVVIWATP